jgi:hypothetical protein
MLVPLATALGRGGGAGGDAPRRRTHGGDRSPDADRRRRWPGWCARWAAPDDGVALRAVAIVLVAAAVTVVAQLVARRGRGGPAGWPAWSRPA